MEFVGEFCPRLNIKIDMLLLGIIGEGILLFHRLYANEDFCVLSKVDV